MTLTPLDPAALDAADLAAALQPFGRSRMLPAAAYTSAAVLAWERRQLFAGGWTCVGRETELRAPGPAGNGARRVRAAASTQRAVTVGDVPVLLTWPSGLSVRAFANTCRHRGHELLHDGEAADRRAVVCPYHAWSYDVNGALIGAPGFREVEGFEPAEHGLVELPARVWHGWVFVCAGVRKNSPDVPGFETYVGELARLVEPYAPERLTLRARHTYEVAANWKVVGENYQECYHCPMIHPELCRVSPPESGENYDLPGAWVGGSMELRADAATMSMSGASEGSPLEGVDPHRVYYLALLPNLLLSLHPDYVMTHRLVPLAPDRTWVECSWYFAGAAVDPSYAVEFWDVTNRQDWAACESVQRGLSSPHFAPGPLAPTEDAVHQWVGMIGRAYRGTPPYALSPTDPPIAAGRGTNATA